MLQGNIFNCQQQKVIFPIFLKNKLQRLQLFFKKLFSFILTWQKSFACILPATVVTAAFNECKIIRKTSFAVGCQLVTGERWCCNESSEVMHTSAEAEFLPSRSMPGSSLHGLEARQDPQTPHPMNTFFKQLHCPWLLLLGVHPSTFLSLPCICLKERRSFWLI